MNILLITSEFGEAGGGLSYACTRFSKFLKEVIGADVTIISSCHNTIETACGGYNPSLYSKISNEYRLKNDTFKFEGKAIELIIAFGGSFNGYYAHLLANRLNSKLFLMLRGTDGNMAKWDSQEAFYLKEAARKSDKIICLSHELAKNVRELVPETVNRVCVIPNPILSISEDVVFPNYPDRLVLGCSAAHINEKKGLLNLLYVVAELKNMLSMPITLKIQGQIDSDLKSKYDVAALELGIKDNISYEGYKPRGECLNDQKEWDIYVQTSVCEGFCNSVADAISSGIPVFLSDTGFISETIRDKYPELVFSCFDPKEVAIGLIKLLESQNICATYKNAYSLVFTKANLQTVENLWRDVFSGFDTRKPQILHHSGILSVALHEVKGEIHDHITTPYKTFIDFVNRICEYGYGLCSLKDYLEKDFDERSRWIVCTFDDGYSSLTEYVMPCLKSKGFTATVFINTMLIGKDNSWNWKDTQRRSHLDKNGIKLLFDNGWEIGSHGHTHRNLLQLTENEIVMECSTSKEVLQNLVGQVSTYAYPYGESSPYIRKICNRFFDYAFALHSGGTELNVDNMQIRRYSMDEIIKILSR